MHVSPMAQYQLYKTSLTRYTDRIARIVRCIIYYAQLRKHMFLECAHSELSPSIPPPPQTMHLGEPLSILQLHKLYIADLNTIMVSVYTRSHNYSIIAIYDVLAKS